ncbi:MAG TPA: PAS domain S-box protein [Desulfobacteria bacterium]|nr:PAS domain S-box protein [Desulfobacteria bacterium]
MDGNDRLLKRGAQSRIKLRAAIIGGGNACHDLLKLLSGERLEQLKMEIVGVADSDPEAPGISLAREMGIFTTPDFTKLYTLEDLNLLIELTGSAAIAEQMIRTKPPHISPIDHRSARLFWDLIQMEIEKKSIQQESEQALIRERDWSQHFIDSLADKILVLDKDRTIHRVNKTFLRKSGLPEADVLGRPCYQITHHTSEPCSGEPHSCPFEEALTTGKNFSVVHNHKSAGGEDFFEEIMATPLCNDKGEIVQVVEGIRDVTHRVKLQEEVRRSKEYLENIIANSSDMIITTDLDRKIVTFNPGAENMLKYPKEEVMGLDIESLWKVPEERRKLMAEVAAKGFVNNYPTTLIARDGYEVEISLSLSQLKDHDGRVLGTVGVSKDVTQENRLQQQLLGREEELRKAHDFLNKSIQSSPNAIIATDMKGNIIIWNQAAEETLGYKATEVIGKMSINRIYPEGTAKKVMQMMRSHEHGPVGKLQSYPMVFVRQDGQVVEGNLSSTILYNTDGTEAASVGIFVDLEERLNMERKLRQTQEQLLQSEKLAAMGRLTSQIAHELNNPLYGIMNTLELLKTEIPPENKRRRILEMSLSETERLAEMLRKMLSFSKPDEEERRPSDINIILDEILLLHEKQLREHSIGISISLAPNLGEVFASKNQLRQVFLNMISNARDAMPEGGTLSVATSRVNDHIHIKISDTGTGIRKENLDRIFDAFFTTKDSVKGVGLGLSVCYGFIKDHGGDIKVSSRMDSGTTFTIILPVHKEAV